MPLPLPPHTGHLHLARSGRSRGRFVARSRRGGSHQCCRLVCQRKRRSASFAARRSGFGAARGRWRTLASSGRLFTAFGLARRLRMPAAMNASTAMQARQAQAAIFSPRLQHAVRLLRLSSQGYAQALRDPAELNPFLEVDEPSAGVLAGGAVPAQDAHPGAGEEADAEAPHRGHGRIRPRHRGALRGRAASAARRERRPDAAHGAARIAVGAPACADWRAAPERTRKRPGACAGRGAGRGRLPAHLARHRARARARLRGAFSKARSTGSPRRTSAASRARSAPRRPRCSARSRASGG
jgi:hypothetical protein